MCRSTLVREWWEKEWQSPQEGPFSAVTMYCFRSSGDCTTPRMGQVKTRIFDRFIQRVDRAIHVFYVFVDACSERWRFQILLDTLYRCRRKCLENVYFQYGFEHCSWSDLRTFDTRSKMVCQLFHLLSHTHWSPLASWFHLKKNSINSCYIFSCGKSVPLWYKHSFGIWDMCKQRYLESVLTQCDSARCILICDWSFGR